MSAVAGPTPHALMSRARFDDVHHGGELSVIRTDSSNDVRPRFAHDVEAAALAPRGPAVDQSRVSTAPRCAPHSGGESGRD